MSDNPYQQTPQAPKPVPVNAKDIAAEKVKVPSILMLVSGVISMVTNLGAGGSFAFIYLGMRDEIMAELERQPQDPEVTPEMLETICNVIGWGGVAFAVAGLFMGLIVIFGAMGMMRLKGWGLALLAAIISVIPCFQGCVLLALPVGIYAMVVLFDTNVKAAFD